MHAPPSGASAVHSPCATTLGHAFRKRSFLLSFTTNVGTRPGVLTISGTYLSTMSDPVKTSEYNVTLRYSPEDNTLVAPSQAMLRSTIHRCCQTGSMRMSNMSYLCVLTRLILPTRPSILGPICCDPMCPGLNSRRCLACKFCSWVHWIARICMTWLG